MKGNDSYPPGNIGKSNSCVEINDFIEGAGDSQTPDEINSEGDEGRKPQDWDGCEAEIVVDDEAEEYEDETTGIKIKYTLKSHEIHDFICHGKGYEKNKKSQKKHTIIQSLVFVLVFVVGLVNANKQYLWLALFPLIAILIVWILPYLSIKRIMRDILKNEEFSVEIFPDKIDVTTINTTREILLDGSCESEEFEDMIFIFSNGDLSLIIPMRSVEPEFRADVQAMILAGAKPRYKS